MFNANQKFYKVVIYTALFFIVSFISINIAKAAYIRDDATGGDCASIGVWDGNAKTCLLTTDLSDSITIGGNGIVLDGANHQIIGNNTGSGIIIDYWENIVVKNLKIQNFAYGIYISNSESNSLTGNIISNNSETGIIFSNSHGNITENEISNNQISGLEISYIALASGNTVYHNNFINNGYQIYAMYDASDFFYQNPPIGGNYWSDYNEEAEGCFDANNDNFCDSPYFFEENSQDNYPWAKQDGWKISTNQPPTFTNLGQFKSDSVTLISESEITTEDVVIFKANITDPDGDDVKLQIELKEFNQPFNEQDLLESDFVNSGSEIVISRESLVVGFYKWRARAVGSQGDVSGWQEFGTAGNVDFEVKLVPLYTQIESDYPSRAETEWWAVQKYGTGNYPDCYSQKLKKSTIGTCGCAITSQAMFLRFHNVTTTADAKAVNPATFNEWLTNNNGYWEDGEVRFAKIQEYSKDESGFARLIYDGPISFKDNQ